MLMSSTISQAQERANNLLELLNTIEVGQPIALAELATLFKTDVDLLRHDIDILANCDVDDFYYIDILVDEDDMVTLMRQPFSLNTQVRLSDEQMLAISLALEMAGANRESDLVKRINNSFAGEHNADFLTRHINITPPAHSFEVFEAVTLAMQFSRPLSFLYEKESGETRQRRADVARITSERLGWYFHGYDHDCKDMRTFKLSRITGPEILYFEKSLGRNNLNVAESTDSSMRIKAEKDAPIATIVFSSKQAFVARDWPYSFNGKQLPSQAGGGYKVDIPIINQEFIAQKVLSMGGLARVKHPQELRDCIHAKATAFQKEFE